MTDQAVMKKFKKIFPQYMEAYSKYKGTTEKNCIEIHLTDGEILYFTILPGGKDWCLETQRRHFDILAKKSTPLVK